MTARFLIGDVFERMAELPDGSFDLIVTSPPFGWLRSYLPDGHPQKHLEIGSEPDPASYLDVLLALTAEWRRLLALHGSLAVELGDTYAGSGGAGGDYEEEGLREGQPKFRQGKNRGGWPLPKSLCGIPTLYAWSLAYGRNLLTGQPSPAGQWRIRNLKAWVRSNPPVGALGDKERPATSYVVVACTGASRWFDLDAVRTQPSPLTNRRTARGVDQVDRNGKSADRGGNWASLPEQGETAGAPPLDWWHPIDALIDTIIDQRAGKANGGANRGNHAGGLEGRLGQDREGDRFTDGGLSVGARGLHIRRALEAAGYLEPQDFYDISPRGYSGAHYAVWPPELIKQLILEMAPQRVCTVCGVPSRRITVDRSAFSRQPELAAHIKERREALGITSAEVNGWFGYKEIAKNWERTDRHGAAIPNPDDWPILADRLGLDRERFDDLVLGERRWTESTTEHVQVATTNGPKNRAHTQGASYNQKTAVIRSDLGWSDCGHNHWRPGRILDPFVGSGTTLAVASGMGRDSVGIDLDERNIDLCVQRVGMFLEVDYEPVPRPVVDVALPDGP